MKTSHVPWIVSILWSLLIPIDASAQPANQKLSDRAIFEGEPFIAMDPANSQNLCVAWMSFRALTPDHPITIVTRSSSDGGATWSAAQDMPHIASGWQSADVSMAWPSADALYMCYIDYLNNSNDSGGVFVARSSDGGRSWGVPIRAIDAKENSYVSLDRPWVAADSSGNLTIATKPAPWHPLPNHTFYTHSTDAGQTWGMEAALDTAPFSSADIKAPMGSPIANGAGIAIAYPYLNISSPPYAGFALATSGDGQHFVRSFILQPTPLKDTLIKGGFRLLRDPARTNRFGGGNRLVLVWPDARNGDEDIYSATTGDTDIGYNWGPPVRVNDDPIGNGVMQDMVWPTFSKDGTLVIVWRDRRNGTGTGYASASDTYYAVSRDGGLTYSKNYRLSDSTAPYQTILDNPGNDFMSAAATHDTLFAAWSDTRNGSVQVYFAKAALGSSRWVGETILSSTAITMSCFPNPADGKSAIFYTMPRSGHCSITLCDAHGVVQRSFLRSEISSGDHQLTASLEGLAEGTYWVLITTADASAKSRLIIR